MGPGFVAGVELLPQALVLLENLLKEGGRLEKKTATDSDAKSKSHRFS